MRKTTQEEFWVLVNPDNNHWKRGLAIIELNRVASSYDVVVFLTGETRDGGHGQEEKFLLEGTEENISSVIEEINEILY